MLPPFRLYVVAVCAASEVSDECLTQAQDVATRAFAESYLKAYRGNAFFNSLRVRFPYGWVRESQLRFLRDVEGAGIRRAKSLIAAEVAGDAAKTDGWEILALAEAADGRNWAHDWSENRHDFDAANALRQFRQANLR